MKHTELKEKIFLLDDKELPEAERTELSAHLKICDECRHRLERWNQIRADLKQMPPVQANPFFAQKVLRRLDEKRPSPVWARPPVFAGMGLACACLLALFFLQTQNESIATDATEELFAMASANDLTMNSLTQAGDLNDDELLRLNLEE